jgi:putative ABC transport system ATP-binding protein
MGSEAGDPLLDLRGVVKDFTLGVQKVRALDGVDLRVAEGEFVVVMGPSGSGKSTLLNLVGGLDRPTAGQIWCQGPDGTSLDIAALDEIALAEYRRRMIGFVFQSFNLISTMTARQNVSFPMVFAGVSASRRSNRADELLRRVGLGHRLDHKPNELSGGEQQRVAIARAMANAPPIVLGDEPTGNLDTGTGAEVMQILSALNEAGRTLIVVSHDVRLATYADRVVQMEDGKLLREEPGGHHHLGGADVQTEEVRQ